MVYPARREGLRNPGIHCLLAWPSSIIVVQRIAKDEFPQFPRWVHSALYFSLEKKPSEEKRNKWRYKSRLVRRKRIPHLYNRIYEPNYKLDQIMWVLGDILQADLASSRQVHGPQERAYMELCHLQRARMGSRSMQRNYASQYRKVTYIPRGISETSNR